jgi:alpha-tubulin suppressor-like RCC1 family protein
MMRSALKATLAGLLAAPLLAITGSPGAIADAGDTLSTTGLGSDGQLGNGSTGNRTTFGAVNTLTNVDEVAGGREHVVALVGGRVYTWGDGSKGATGLGSTADRSTPTLIPNLTNVVNVSTGHYHSLALLADGSIRAWGFNSMGQLGDGTTKKRLSPVTVRNISTAVDIVGGRDMSYALLADGTVRAWGGGANGELGNGSHTAKQTTPVTVSGLSNVIELAGGRNHALALKSDGTVWAWGLNSSGQLGDGTKTSRATPVQVRGISTAVAIAAGADHSVALLANGAVMTWGEAGRGQLGNGSTVDKTAPVTVTGLPSDVVFIGCGRDHTLAITSDGQLWDWGMNDFGQLGDGTTTKRTRPVHIAGISNAVEAHGGRGYTVIRRDVAARLAR